MNPGLCPPPLRCYALLEVGDGTEKRELLVEIVVLLKPVYLRPDITVDDITLLVLKTPGDDDQEVTFAYPEPLFDLAFNPSGARDAVFAADTDVVCPEHQVGPGEYLPVSLLW